MRSLSSLIRALRSRLAGSRADHADIFTDIFRKNSWGSAESVSGPGSTRERGSDFSHELIALLRRLNTRTLLDAPCGDFNWIGEVADQVDRYIGVDVVPDLVARNLRLHANERRIFFRADISVDPLPPADVILCRDCLVHFSNRDVWTTLANFRRSGSRYLLTTTFVGRSANGDIRTGAWRPLNLQAAPFGFPPPLHAADERCHHSGGIYQDKRLALWELESLPTRPPA